MAQDGPAPAAQSVVVTGTASPVSWLRTSTATSFIDGDQIQERGADSASDLLRSVPGLLVQSSGGEGNANISARGLPLSGGAKFVLYEEDGLPTLAFGDIDFATADTFVRVDGALRGVEVLRGGSASTLASNAPGGIVNFISRTGRVAGGMLAVTRGLDFDRNRVDFAYGAPLDPRWRFQVGGFYRQGDGERPLGYRAENGGQFRGNLTWQAGDDRLRVSVKLLDDRTPVWLPVPASVTGSGNDPQVGSIPGFNLGGGALQTPALLSDLSVGRDGRVLRTDVRDGYFSHVQALGLEGSHRFRGGWTFEAKARVERIGGRFVGPYPAEVGPAATLATEIGGPGASLRYATGPQAGQAVADPASLAGNGLAVRTLLFDTTLNDMNHSVADLRLSHRTEGSWGWMTTVLGLFADDQAIDQDWHWNTYLEEVQGRDAQLLDVVAADGSLLTQRGLVSYGEPYWGNCCVRAYRLRYRTTAPYLQWHAQRGALDLDASVREDVVRARGSYAGAGTPQAFDVNGDGVIQPPEAQVPIVNPATTLPVGYTVHYVSLSLGGSVLLARDLSLFGRASRGGRANAERILFGGGIRPDGGAAGRIAVDQVNQQELGLKFAEGRDLLSAILFHASTRLFDQDVTSVTNRFYSRLYEARGLELEASARLGVFALDTGLTYTVGRVAEDNITPQAAGTQVNPHLMGYVAPSARWPGTALTLNFIGVGRFPPVTGGMPNPGFVQVNASCMHEFGARWRVQLVANNLFNRIGVTEMPNAAGGITPDGVNTARSITGRTVQLAINYAL